MRHVLLAVLLAAPLAAQDVRVLRPGEGVTGTLTDADPVARQRGAPYHVWNYDGRRGERVTFDLVSSDFDAYLVVRDEAGFVTGRDDDSGEDRNARLRLVLPRDGRYSVVVTGFSSEARGRYTLRAQAWPSPSVPGPGAVTSIRPGQSRDGLLEPGDEFAGDGPFQDRWTVEARIGQRLRVEMVSTDLDSYLVVLGPDGRPIVSDDDGLGGRDSELSFRVSAAGRYTILATSFGDDPSTGFYRLTVEEETAVFPDPGVTAAIAPGQSMAGLLEHGDETGERGLQDRWTFGGRAGQIVRIDLRSAAFDPYLVLRHGERDLDANDDGGEGTDSRLTVQLPATGTYTIVASALSSGSDGRYTLALTSFDTPAPPGRVSRIEPGRPHAGRLERGDARRRDEDGFQDVWEFDGRAGQEVIVDLASPDFDAYVELRDPRDQLIGFDDDGGDGRNASLAARLTANGRHRIVATSYGGGEATGLYEISLEVAVAALPPGRVTELTLGRVLLGRLEEGDSVMEDGSYGDVYVFRAPRDGALTLDLRSSEFDTYLTVKDAAGQTVATNDDGGSGTNSLLVLRVRAGQTYRIHATSYGGDPVTGAYRMTARYQP